MDTLETARLKIRPFAPDDLDAAHRGRGYATEALQALIAHAFGVLGVGRLVAGTGRDNAPSIALLRRVGMRTFASPYGGWPEVIGVLENPGAPGSGGP